MTDRRSEEERALVEDSDRLVESIERLRELEREKRTVPMSSPRFRELAEEIRRLASVVFGEAASEEFDAKQADDIDRSIDEAAEAEPD